MPLTLADLAADARLHLRVVAGGAALDRVVSWVHVSELADPTPFLDGGELLLTTGLGLAPGSDLTAFVARLAGRGVSGLGFGTGLSHAAPPDGLLAAADAAGLPVLEVPREVPFIAISKAVSAAQAADAYAEVVATNSAQQSLTRVALGAQGPAGVVRRLAQLLGGWAALLDRSGTVLHAAPARPATSAPLRRAGVGPALDRLRRGRLASAAFEAGGEHVVAQVVGRRVLVVGRPDPLDRTAQQIIGAAASVLTLAVARSTALDRAHRRLRTGLLRLLLDGHTALATDVALAVWEAPPAPGPVTVLTGPAAAREAQLEQLDGFFAELDDHLVVLGAVPRDPVAGLSVGVSEAVPLEFLADGHRQALVAADAARRAGTRLVRFADLAGGGLLGLLPGAAGRAFADALLAPLGDLTGTLAVWLRHHGQWDPAAAELGVHRHTVRNRIRRVAELTGRDLDSPDVRAELWLAVRLRSIAG
ncbi:PucR family transcriptional regulator ligand-binding domain-containing protein [Dactylosporangium sucinum]|uniref:PucR family transcriptional regulator n=1 Tax=Dactylosporangium sucinum TaxID=1424081 RepID=A0A917WZR2_9ACTN|nr:PucR family transcriptional regulator [Dactylosporangium sucinum]GGM45305.1 PucR family transcriptional regulator [Dactylosporangium sucinum]